MCYSKCIFMTKYFPRVLRRVALFYIFQTSLMSSIRDLDLLLKSVFCDMLSSLKHRKKMRFQTDLWLEKGRLQGLPESVLGTPRNLETTF